MKVIHDFQALLEFTFINVVSMQINVVFFSINTILKSFVLFVVSEIQNVLHFSFIFIFNNDRI